MSELKPCPFCEAENEVEDDEIECIGCGVKIQGWTGCDGIVSAEEIYQDRPIEDALTARVNELEGILKNITAGIESGAASIELINEWAKEHNQ